MLLGSRLDNNPYRASNNFPRNTNTNTQPPDGIYIFLKNIFIISLSC